MLSRRRFPDVIADPVDDDSCAIGIAYNTAERFADLAQMGRVLVQEIEGCTSVVACGGDRLIDLVSDRSSELTQSRYTTHMGKFGLYSPNPRFAFGEIVVQTGILKRDRGLRREQL